MYKKNKLKIFSNFRSDGAAGPVHHKLGTFSLVMIWEVEEVKGRASFKHVFAMKGVFPVCSSAFFVFFSKAY